MKALPPQLAGFYQAGMKDAGPVARRSLLARLVNDLQWRYTVNEVKRRYAQEITSRTGRLFAWSLGLFVVGTAVMVLSGDLGTKFYAPDLKLLLMAALAGTWGAAFSMLSSLKGRLDASELDEMKLMRPTVMLVSRVLIGTGAGCVLYFLVRSGLLGGQAFPVLEQVVEGKNDAAKHLALLIIWSFIAGFSEKLVPSILEKSVARVTTADAVDAGRYRPERPSSSASSDPAKQTSAVETGKASEDATKK
jgi:MFS family permease